MCNFNISSGKLSLSTKQMKSREYKKTIFAVASILHWWIDFLGLVGQPLGVVINYWSNVSSTVASFTHCPVVCVQVQHEAEHRIVEIIVTVPMVVTQPFLHLGDEMAV